MTLMHYLGLPSPIKSAYLLGIKQSTAERIISAVSGYTGVRADLMKSTCKWRAVVEARYIAMYLMRHGSGMTLKAIGDLFHRDHSTIIYAVRKCADYIETDPEFRKKYEQIMKEI